MMKAIAIAFSTYSKIPMPHFKWDPKALQYSMCAFPLVGAVDWCGRVRDLVSLWFSLTVVGGLHSGTSYGIPDPDHRRHSYGWILRYRGCEIFL